MTKTQLTVAITGMALSGLLGSMIPEMNAAMARANFDYESCQAIVAKGDLANAPVDHWREMVTTPGGNWCIR